MANEKTQIERIQALVASVNNHVTHYTLVVDQEYVKEEIGQDELSVHCLITTRCFSDGAPVIKQFSREKNETTFVFDQERYHVAYDGMYDQMYWFYGGVWYLAEDAYQLREMFFSPGLEGVS